MGQTHIQTRVPDELDERIDEYEKNHDYMNRAEAVRALLRTALEAEAEPQIETDGGQSRVDWLRERMLFLIEFSGYGLTFTAIGWFVSIFNGINGINALVWLSAGTFLLTALLAAAVLALAPIVADALHKDGSEVTAA